MYNKGSVDKVVRKSFLWNNSYRRDAAWWDTKADKWQWFSWILSHWFQKPTCCGRSSGWYPLISSWVIWILLRSTAGRIHLSGRSSSYVPQAKLQQIDGQISAVLPGRGQCLYALSKTLTRLEFGAECWPAAAIQHFSEGISVLELLNTYPWCGFVKSGPGAVSPSWNGNTVFQRFEKGAFLQLRKNASLPPWP